MKAKITITTLLITFILTSCMSGITPTRIKTSIPHPTVTQTGAPPSPHEIFEEFSGRYPIVDINGLETEVLTIASDGTFRYEEFSDGKRILDIKGSIVIEKTTIQLIPSTTSPSPPETSFILARWNPRRYIIEESRKNEFCDSIMLGNEPRNDSQGIFYMREGDWSLQVESQVVSLTGVPFCFMD